MNRRRRRVCRSWGAGIESCFTRCRWNKLTVSDKFAAERRAAGGPALPHPGCQRPDCCSSAATMGRTCGQTDGRTPRPLHRPCSAYYVCSAEINGFSPKVSTALFCCARMDRAIAVACSRPKDVREPASPYYDGYTGQDTD